MFLEPALVWDGASLIPTEARLRVVPRSGPDVGIGESSEGSERSLLTTRDGPDWAWWVSAVKVSLS